MRETLVRLYGLQEVDKEITKLLKGKEEVPKRIEDLHNFIKEAKEELEREEKTLIDLKKSYKNNELDLSSCEEKLSKYSLQLYAAKTNEEYKGFLKEIETQERIKEGTEEKMLEFLQAMEDSERAIEKREKDVLEKEKEISSKVKEEEARLIQILSDIEKAEKDRKILVEGMEKNVLDTYERIRKSKNGLAVVKIEENRCGGCLNPLPAQLILEVKKSDRLHFCEYCGRILVL